MKLFSLLLLLCALFQDAIADDETVIEHYSKQGKCFDYKPVEWDKSYFDVAKSLAPCKIWCEKQTGDAGASCDVDESTAADHSGRLLQDDNGHYYVPANCRCQDGALAKVLANTIAESLSRIDEVICATMLTGVSEAVDVGLAYIPGGQASPGLRKAIQGAKSFAENGGNAADFFGGWIGPACGLDDWPYDKASVFEFLIHTPDSMGASVGCKKDGHCDEEYNKPGRRARTTGSDGKEQRKRTLPATQCDLTCRRARQQAEKR